MFRNRRNFFSFGRRSRRLGTEIDPDEIFLDARNLPDFDVHQFEGVIERPIGKSSIVALGIFFLIVVVLFVGRVGFLQVVNGEGYAVRSEENRLQHTPLFSERGIIYDRNNVELAWNVPGDKDFSFRKYTSGPGLAHVLGYVGYPAVDKRGFYYQREFIGKAGVEKSYSEQLNGVNGLKILETNALLEVKSESTIKPAKDGEKITLSIDSRIQSFLFNAMKNLAADKGFVGGAAIMMDIMTGELIALTNFPEYDSQILSDGEDSSAIAGFQTSTANPFLNRAVSGLYTPGSIVKPFVALAALTEKVIDPQKSILSTGSISIPNPYNPNLATVFTDWKAHGWVDMRKALAVSSNVYFYEVGGGFEDQKGLGINKIEKYYRMFGIGERTGVDIAGDAEGIIPTPSWKERVFDGDPWRIGNTYQTAIGQYGLQVTPLQMTRAIGAIANNGGLVTPHVVKRDEVDMNAIEGISASDFKIVQEGMRQAVTDGTAKGLHVPYVEIAAKTGTAELGTTRARVNSWIVGFFPYENPQYAFTVVMEKGPRSNTIGGLYVMRQLFDWMNINTPEYLKN